MSGKELKPQSSFKYVPVSKVVPDPNNPALRTTKTALSSIRKSIEEFGIVQPLDVIYYGGSYHVGNGHRRLASALSLGLGEVPVQIYDWPFERRHELWAILSRTKTINAQNWAEYWFKSGGTIDLPSKVKSDVLNMVRIWGKKRARELVVDEHISPNLVHCLRQVVVRLVEVPSIGEISEREIGDWLIKHRMQNNVNALFSGGLRPPVTAMRKLAKCIRNDEPYDVFGRKAA